MNLYVTYRDEDGFPAKELYRSSPVLVSLTPQEAEKLSELMEIGMTLLPTGSVDVQIRIGEKEFQKHFDKLPAVFPTDEGTVAFFENKDTLAVSPPKEEGMERHITAFIN